MVLVTGAAVLVGLVLFVLLVVRPGPTATPGTSGNPYGFVKPDTTIPTNLVNGRTIGKADAPVEMDVWADFQCPYCSQFARLIEPQVIANQVASGQVKLVAHDFTFIGDGHDPNESLLASVAARCAEKQGAFWQFYQLLFWNQGSTENNGTFTQDRLLGMADFLGLDHDAFQTCQADSSLVTAIQQETNQGVAMGIQSTPTSFINGTMVLGLKDFPTISGLIDAAAASASPAAGSPAGSSPGTSPSAAASSPSPSGASSAP